MPINWSGTEYLRGRGAPDFLQRGGLQTIAALESGQAARIREEDNRRRQGLHNIAMQESKLKLEDMEREAAKLAGIDALQDKLNAYYKAGDDQGVKETIREMSLVDPKAAGDINQMYRGVSKQILGEAAYPFLASVRLPDLDSKNQMVRQALEGIEEEDPTHPAARHLRGILSMPLGDERDKAEIEGVTILRELGLLPGMGTAEDQYKEREMRVKEAGIELRRSEAEFRKDEAAWEKTRLTPSGEKILEKVDDRIFENEKTVGQYETLAQDFDRLTEEGVTGGKIGWAREKLKDWLGSQDEVSLLYRKFRGLRASGAVKNLPPGVASDKDIELALSGTPPEDAGPEFVASWLRGAAKMAKLDSLYHQARSNFLSENKTLAGFSGWWKDNKAQVIADEFGMSLEEVMTEREKAPTGMEETRRLNTMTTKEAATKTARKIKGAAEKPIEEMGFDEAFNELINTMR